MKTENNNNETWVTIKGYENFECSTEGRIRRLTKVAAAKPGEVKKIQKNSVTGYCHVKLSGSLGSRSVSLHRVIAENLIPNPNNYKEVDHLNRDKTDNRVVNLRWTTRQENMRNVLTHCYRAVIVVLPNGTEQEFESIAQCARELQIMPQGINNVLREGQPHYKGLKFRYVNGN